MQTSPVLAIAHRSDEVKKISPARQLRLDARRENTAVWTAPKRYLKTTPFFAFVRDFLSPSSPQPGSDLPDSDSDSSGFDVDGSPSACREKGGYGNCFEHRPSQEQRVNRRAAQLWNRYRQDHLEACGGAVTPVPEQPFRFLDLLPELRTEIYQLILRKPKVLLQFDPDQSEPESTEAGSDEEMGPVDVRLFVVSKRIYEEATTVFFGRNIFKIELIGLEYLTLPSPMFRTGFQPTNQLLINKLKRLQVDISPNRRCDWALRIVCKKLADRASLLDLRINAHGPSIWGVKVDKEMNEMFEILTIVRGVGSVMFNDPTMSTSTLRVWQNTAFMRILGSQVQRDRVSRIMTAAK
ncbi:MAG: hypothetical protein Q9221_001506 [Calogaya cf. arnoldii]